VRASFSYAYPLGASFTLGVNAVVAGNAFDPEIISREEDISAHDYGEGYTSLYYRSSSESRDDEESLTSLRFGILQKFSEKSSLDFEVTVSRTRASAFANMNDVYQRLSIYPDSTTMREDENINTYELDPFDKEVIEGNLFIHRTARNARLSFRASFFSGDTGRRSRSDFVSKEAEITDLARMTETMNDVGWTGGLVGMGVIRSGMNGKLDFTIAGFYGFMRAHDFETRVVEQGITAKTYDTVHEKDRWDSHFVQINLGTQYKATRSIAAILGGRATGIFMNSEWMRTSIAEAEGFTEKSEQGSSSLDLTMSAGITGGAMFTLTDRISLSVYTPDLTGLISWQLESLITF
jgi:hypothetical protein